MAAGISVLRLLSVTKPDDLEWIDKLLRPLGNIFLSFGNGQASIQKGIPLSYLLMAYTDINNEKTNNAKERVVVRLIEKRLDYR